MLRPRTDAAAPQALRLMHRNLGSATGEPARPPASLDPPPPPGPGGCGDWAALAQLFLDSFRRDLQALIPHLRCEPLPTAGPTPSPTVSAAGPILRPLAAGAGSAAEPEPLPELEYFGIPHRLSTRQGSTLSRHERRLLEAVASVYAMRFVHLFGVSSFDRIDLYRGGSEDHYIAAFVEPQAYGPQARAASRVAATILTLRTAALSTYENQRVSTGVLLLGPGEVDRPSPPDALLYSVELTALKSIHRLCDGQSTLFLVDLQGRLAEIIDLARWEQHELDDEGGSSTTLAVPCARAYERHARATRGQAGHVCVVLSPSQEIKVFAEGVQTFTFAHGRWRILDAAAKFAQWTSLVPTPGLGRALFQAALNLAEQRRGALFVVLDEPATALERLIAAHDRLEEQPQPGPPPELAPGDPLARRALHYLARGRSVQTLDPAVLEALAGLDGALVADRDGRLLAFGAILQQDLRDLAVAQAEGARTTAALVASRYGAVLKVSEDGVVSGFHDGRRLWDL